MIDREKRLPITNKQTFTVLGLWIIFLLSIGFATAATVTIHFPLSKSVQNAAVTGATVDGGNLTINASVEIDGGDLNITMVNFSYRTGPSADWILISYDSLSGNDTDMINGGNATNLTSNAGNHTYSFPWNITGLADGSTYQLNASAYNDTVLVGSTVNTFIVIDQTNPTTKLDVLDPATKKTKTKVFFSDSVILRCTRTDATIGYNDTNMSIKTPIDTQVEHLEKSTRDQTVSEDFDVTFKRTKNLGDYLVLCSTTDKAGNINSTTNYTFEVVTKPPTGGSPYLNEDFKSPVATVIIGAGSSSAIGPLTESGISRLVAKTATAIFTVYEKEHSFTVKELNES